MGPPQAVRAGPPQAVRISGARLLVPPLKFVEDGGEWLAGTVPDCGCGPGDPGRHPLTAGLQHRLDEAVFGAKVSVPKPTSDAGDGVLVVGDLLGQDHAAVVIDGPIGQSRAFVSGRSGGAQEWARTDGERVRRW